MKKKHLFPLLAALVCAAGLLWMRGGDRPALLDDLALPGGGASVPEVAIGDQEVPLAEAPGAEDLQPDQSGAEDPFDQFTQDQRDAMEEVLELVNQAREEAGLAPLELDPALCGAAQVRARECVGTFSHTRPDGTSYKTAIAQAEVESGYTGENVATGHSSAKQVVAAWMKSEGHRANILNEKFTKLGVGLEKNTGNRYQGYAWAQLFVK